MSSIYFTPTYNAKPCFMASTVLYNSTTRLHCDPSCGDNGACYNYSFWHIGNSSEQNFCDGSGCGLNEYWLYVSMPSNNSYEYFSLVWSSRVTADDRIYRKLYFGATSTKYSWFSTSYLSLTDTSTASLLWENSTKKLVIFSNARAVGDNITYKDSLELHSNSAKSGLEAWKNNYCTVFVQAQASGGLAEFKDSLASYTTTQVWASDDNAGLSVVSSLTADIVFNTSVLTQNSAGVNDVMTFRNLGSSSKPWIVACTNEVPHFNYGQIYIDGYKFVVKTFSVCIGGTTKQMRFLASEVGVDS